MYSKSTDQVVVLFLIELKHEIGRKAIGIAFDGLHQRAHLYLIQFRQVITQHHLLAANQINPSLDYGDWNR